MMRHKKLSRHSFQNCSLNKKSSCHKSSSMNPKSHKLLKKLIKENFLYYMCRSRFYYRFHSGMWLCKLLPKQLNLKSSPYRNSSYCKKCNHCSVLHKLKIIFYNQFKQKILHIQTPFFSKVPEGQEVTHVAPKAYRLEEHPVQVAEPLQAVQ